MSNRKSVKKVLGLIMFIILIITLCSCESIKDFFDTSPKKISDGKFVVSDELRKHITDDTIDKLVLEKDVTCIGIQDCYSSYIFSYPSEMDSIIVDKDEWRLLPMTEDEYDEYIKCALAWSLEDFNGLEEYNLTAPETKGYWCFVGSKLVKDSANNWNKQYYSTYNQFLSTREIIIILEDENKIINARED